MSQWRLHPDLPIFAVGDGTTFAAYVPGQVMPASRRLLAELEQMWSRPPSGAADSPAPAAAVLVRAAAAAVAEWRQLHSRPYQPVCLNVQLPYACDLACAYCYTRPPAGLGTEPARLNRAAVAAAASLVAESCAACNHPFQLVLQGLGEPTQCWDDLQWCVQMSRAAAVTAGVRWSAHLSTNGQLAAERAAWVGATFGHVTVSCDGPPDIQDVVRPRRDGTASSGRLAACVAALRASPATLEARVTITAANARRLADVVRYLAADLGIHTVRLEPAFSPAQQVTLPAPEEMAELCLEACACGAAAAVDVCLSSPDLTHPHGEYCAAARQTLRIGPAGTAWNCLHGNATLCQRPNAIGHYDEGASGYTLDAGAVIRARAAVAGFPAACDACVNTFHCTRSCPDACPESPLPTDYRCRFQKRLAEAWILGSMVSSAGEREVREEASRLPAGCDRDDILAEARRALRHYGLHEHTLSGPAWADPQGCLQGRAASAALVAASRGRQGPISVYVHLPFCRRRCVFCDCHSVVAGRNPTARHREYLARIVQDLDAWCGNTGIGGRSVTTVHLGGGTPDAVGYPLLAELCAALRQRLAIGSRTEWAIETTAAGAAPRNVERLLSLGFRRLHVGVQTLNDDLRRRLGRTHRAAEVLAHLHTAMAVGMVTSVDLLYGLPGQDAAMLLADLDRLAQIGIHGVSLYRLNISVRNRALLRVFPGFQQQPLRECMMLQAAEQYLLRHHYAKNHHTHYARPEDADLYFRHAVREEDLLALGASAAGVIGPWDYRCGPYPEYLHPDDGELPIAALAREDLAAADLRLAAHLMAGWVPAAVFSHRVTGPLAERWLSAGLVRPDGGGYRLSATGAWLLGTMIRELRQAGKLASGRC